MPIRAFTIWTRMTIALLLPLISAVHAEEATIKISNFTFDPPVLKVKARTVVTWSNEDDIPHTVAAAVGSFKSKPLDTDEKYAFAFSTPGTYEYFCSLHPQMTATIIVEGTTSQK